MGKYCSDLLLDLLAKIANAGDAGLAVSLCDFRYLTNNDLAQSAPIPDIKTYHVGLNTDLANYPETPLHPEVVILTVKGKCKLAQLKDSS